MPLLVDQVAFTDCSPSCMSKQVYSVFAASYLAIVVEGPVRSPSWRADAGRMVIHAETPPGDIDVVNPVIADVPGA